MCTKCENKNLGKSFINLNPFLPQKQIKVVDEFNKPIPSVEIVNLRTKNGILTNNQGNANVIGNAGDLISISHVAFMDEQSLFETLPSTISMQTEYLDEAVVNVDIKPKAASFAVLGIIALGIGAAVYFNNKKGEGLKGNVPAVSPVPVTL